MSTSQTGTTESPYTQAVDRVWDIVDEDSVGVLSPARWMELHDPPQTAINCIRYEPQSSFRIMHGESELTFKFVGIVDRYSLPPFHRKLTNPSHIAYLLQLVTIASGSSKRFAANADALSAFLRVVSRMVPYATDRKTLASIDSAITTSNRLFSPKDFVGSQDSVALPYSMDPTGDLAASAAAADLVHTEENEVEYLQLENGMYTQITPASIQRGDIVEIRFSVVFYHNSKTTLVPKLELRAVISHSTRYSDAYKIDAQRQDNNSAPEQVVRRLKRARVDTGARGGIPRADTHKRAKISQNSDRCTAGEAQVRAMEVDVQSVQSQMSVLGLSGLV